MTPTPRNNAAFTAPPSRRLLCAAWENRHRAATVRGAGRGWAATALRGHGWRRDVARPWWDRSHRSVGPRPVLPAHAGRGTASAACTCGSRLSGDAVSTGTSTARAPWGHQRHTGDHTSLGTPPAPVTHGSRFSGDTVSIPESWLGPAGAAPCAGQGPPVSPQHPDPGPPRFPPGSPGPVGHRLPGDIWRPRAGPRPGPGIPVPGGTPVPGVGTPAGTPGCGGFRGPAGAGGGPGGAALAPAQPELEGDFSRRGAGGVWAELSPRKGPRHLPPRLGHPGPHRAACPAVRSCAELY